MAAKDETSVPEEAPHREDFSDFALVLKNGHELVCHKIKLAEVSPFFCAMLKQECMETQTNKMKVTEFERDTVETFLDYVYADLKVVPDQEQDLCKRTFDKKRLTPELLRMCHMYQVTNLQDKCIQHLKKAINDDNVVDIWTVAETIGNDGLKKGALDHLWKTSNKLLAVPGLKETFHSPKLMESLVTYMEDQRMLSPRLAEEIITVNVNCLVNGLVFCTEVIQVKLSDTIETLRQLVTDRLDQSRASQQLRCRNGKCLKYGAYLKEDKTVDSYNLKNGTELECLLVKR